MAARETTPAASPPRSLDYSAGSPDHRRLDGTALEARAACPAYLVQVISLKALQNRSLQT